MARHTRNTDQSAAERRPIGGLLLAIGSWILGSLAIIGGAVSETTPAVERIALIVLGVLLVPAVRERVSRIARLPLTAPAAIGLAVAILALMAVQGKRLQAEREHLRLTELAREQERERQDSLLLVRYSFIERDSLIAWRSTAADSATVADHRFAAFLKRQTAAHQQHLADSVALMARLRAESVANAKKRRQDSIVEAREAARLAAVQRQEQRRLEKALAPESDGGRTIYTGPRGGRYYINSNGNKTYIH